MNNTPITEAQHQSAVYEISKLGLLTALHNDMRKTFEAAIKANPARDPDGLSAMASYNVGIPHYVVVRYSQHYNLTVEEFRLYLITTLDERLEASVQS